MIGILSVASSSFAASLDLTPLHRELQFNLGNPGARSLGMGGAFLGRADDASAAEANPAGLTVIATPEFTFELGQTDYTSEIPRPAAGSTLPRPPEYDSISDGSFAPTFLSFAAPVTGFVVSAYYHRPLDFRQTFSPGNGTDVDVLDANKTLLDKLSNGAFIDYRMETYAVAGAMKRGQFSIGASIRQQRLDPSSAGTICACIYGKGLAIQNVETTGTDTDTTYSIGFKWATVSEAMSVGAVYKSGGSFRFTETKLATGSLAAESQTSFFDAPDVVGLGISVRPAEYVTVNADVVRVGYSNLLENYVPILTASGNSRSDYKLSDATEVRLGVEWVRPNASVPFALRAGWWFDPAHSLEYKDNLTHSTSLREFLAYEFPEGESQNHVSVGVGYLGSSYELNAAYDYSSASRRATVSFLKRF